MTAYYWISEKWMAQNGHQFKQNSLRANSGGLDIRGADGGIRTPDLLHEEMLLYCKKILVNIFL
jgi:hypothetical protein